MLKQVTWGHNNIVILGVGTLLGVLGGDQGGIWGDFVISRFNFPLVCPNLAMCMLRRARISALGHRSRNRMAADGIEPATSRKGSKRASLSQSNRTL